MSDWQKDREQQTVDLLAGIMEKRLAAAPPVMLALPNVSPRAPLANTPAWYRLTLQRTGNERSVIVLAPSLDDAVAMTKEIFGPQQFVKGERLRYALGELG